MPKPRRCGSKISAGLIFLTHSWSC